MTDLRPQFGKDYSLADPPPTPTRSLIALILCDSNAAVAGSDLQQRTAAVHFAANA
jgi:hypothetical protein